MKKGVSIPINTLVMLAVAIIVLLAAVAWFMGAFAPTATSANLKQRFDTSCISWTGTNCEDATGTSADSDGDGVPDNICDAYMEMTDLASCTHGTVAEACGCSRPYGSTPP